MNVAELLRRQASLRASQVALVDRTGGRSRRTTFAALDESAAKRSALLHRAGVRPGDPVLVALPMGAELYITLAAILRLGAVAMFLDSQAGRRHLERACAERPPRAIIAGPRTFLYALLTPALRRIPQRFSIGRKFPGAIPLDEARGLTPRVEIEPVSPGSPALLSYTSGTTGSPKAVLRTHGFLMAQHLALEKTLDLSPGELYLTALPLFVLAHLASGAASLIPDADLRKPGAIDPAPVLAQIDAEIPSAAVASPSFYERIAQYCERRGRLWPGLRKLFTGGAPVFPSLLDRLQRLAPSAELVAVYGSSEAEPMARLALPEILETDRNAMGAGKGLLVGQPAPGVSLHILPDQWGRPIGPFTPSQFGSACLPPNSPGEIVVSGLHVLSGETDDARPPETRVLEGETAWHRTGDAGYLDERGRLWLLGRCSARIEDDRGTLYPLGLECVAHEQPGVRRAAVVSHRGRRVLALELTDRSAERRLAAVFGPTVDVIRVFKRLPVDRRHNSKIDYPALARLLEKHL